MTAISSPTYDHQRYEKKWTAHWKKNDIYSVDKYKDKKPYTILMPPPNVTSQLHMGHGTCYSFQDILIRYYRMLGYNAFWLPGTDHAGIATQMMVAKDLLAKENKTPTDLGREAFVQRCKDWKEKYGDLIYEQFERIGFSADYNRKSYTMDEHLSNAVREVFCRLFEEKLIYRGQRLVNWDPVLGTAISDDEIDNQEIDGKLYSIIYKSADNPEETITIATTRPETLLGDTAICVHPDDERYTSWVGRKLIVPIVGREIPIIADEYVKQDFGTGALKITPAHDPNDFELGKKHGLDFIDIFDDKACLNQNCPEHLQGLDRFVARKEIVQELKDLSQLKEQKSYRHTVPHSDRSKSIIEPKLSFQWFVKMEELAKPAADAARNNELKFHPDSWKKTYLHWLDNIQDWCISRQLWWGHRIPVWTCDRCQHVFSARVDPSECPSCKATEIKQDPDILDTWFSSWLWPLSPLGWPNKELEKKLDLDMFYPSQVLVTAPEIIFLWVARMVMAGLKFKGKIPFQDVYLAAVVTDQDGVKFSKTLGNGIDPLDVIEKHGADAVRYTGVSLAPLGGRVMMSKDDFDVGAKFVNKIWNAGRLLEGLLNSHKDSLARNFDFQASMKEDVFCNWILNKLSATAIELESCFKNYRLNDAIDKIYHFVWDDFCDWGLEIGKYSSDHESAPVAARRIKTLQFCFDQILKMLHPILPFVTEELWSALPKFAADENAESIALSQYPTHESLSKHFHPDENSNSYNSWVNFQNLISKSRAARQLVKLSSKELVPLIVWADEKSGLKNVVSSFEPFFNKQAGAISTTWIKDRDERPVPSVAAVGMGFCAYLDCASLVDLEAEKKRLLGEKKRISGIVNGLQKKLGNERFVKNAPEDVIKQTREQENNMSSQLEAIDQSLSSL